MDGWETVHSVSRFEETNRLKVPGGWIYQVVRFGRREEDPDTMCLTFVPEPSPIVVRFDAP